MLLIPLNVPGAEHVVVNKAVQAQAYKLQR